ncbi:MAG: LON peptidase substrate-binding domain-containing protein [Pseudomonadota bacterium]|nr:LON peptidase substrate-binding domain-containing protein [Pseudomonadota bacterium]
MKNFPEVIPVFPLDGVIYFPKTNLPLNIFEQRYLDLVNDAYNKNKLMGMVQSKKESQAVYEIGCLGKISNYQKSKDGRILINLTGVTRFKIVNEIDNNKLYREFRVDYTPFTADLKNTHEDVNAIELMEKVKSFFSKNGLLLNWREFEKLDHLQQINTLAMIAPITNEEKQKLLESISLESKMNTLKSIISFYLYETGSNSQTIQ